MFLSKKNTSLGTVQIIRVNNQQAAIDHMGTINNYNLFPKEAVDASAAKAKEVATSAIHSAKNVMKGAEELLDKARKRSGEFIQEEAQMIKQKLTSAAATLKDKASGFTDPADPTTRTIRELRKKAEEHTGHNDEMDHVQAERTTKYK